jgi:hypothetical protein
MGKRERSATPPAFRDALLAIAAMVAGLECADEWMGRGLVCDFSAWLRTWRRCVCCGDRGRDAEARVPYCSFCEAGCEECHWYKPGHGGKP